MDMLVFAKRLKETRTSKNVSAEELAQVCGVNKGTIHRYENAGFKSIKSARLETIANYLMVDIDYLTGKSDDRFSDKSLKDLSKKEKKEIDDILYMTSELLKQDGLMFDGKPADEESIKSILDAMEVGLEIAKRKNKQKYTPKKYKER